MSSYDNQYNLEESLFGEPYPEFVALIDSIDHKGDALDLGCGQGRDALMLAQQGYSVTGVDASEVGIRQMVERASALGLSVTGVVGDFHAFDFPQQYDLAVLDSILHFAEDKEKEIDLLDRVLAHTRKDGYVCIFIHKDAAKETAPCMVTSRPKRRQLAVGARKTSTTSTKRSASTSALRSRCTWPS
ncbi:MAG: class I SAM-dependent methyltransferase [Caldilineaceae bacterium]